MLKPTTATITLAFLVSLGASGCKGKSSSSDDNEKDKASAARAPEEADTEWESWEDSDSTGSGYAADGVAAFDEGKMGGKGAPAPAKKLAAGIGRGRSGAIASEKSDKAKDQAPPGGAQAERGEQTRSWFPETFLFEPLVVTDDNGTAQVTVRVPDRLTNWRVLALAHSRGGAQAGATTSFLGTLPIYVDPVVPAFLRAGDRVRLPIQVVNTTDKPIAGRLTVDAVGAALAGGDGRLTIPANGSVVRYAELRAPRPGEVRLRAAFGGADAIVRTIEVMPTGRPIDVTRSGTLAAPRAFDLIGPESATPGTDRARLQVFPGALAILRSELAASLGRGGVAEDAFATLLAGKAAELLKALGDEPDPKAIRRLSILTTQRVVRHARRLDMTTATLLADAALAHPDNPVLTGIGNRAVQYLAANQLPDGTCGGQTGWTLQRLLVATADCARAAVGERTVVIRASGAFERHAEAVQDPYTAAAILASGAATGKLADLLRERVLAAITDRKDGSKVLTIPRGVVRADGARPSVVEATALAVLALEGVPKAPLADLGSTILSGYSPAWGWGDGRANLVCMQAVLRLFKDPIPPNTKITLRMGDTVITSGELTRERIREVLILEASDLTAVGSRAWSVEAQPNVPGLGFSLALTSWVSWPAAKPDQGVELKSDPPANLAVGKPAELQIRAVAPAGQTVRIRQSLPAGVQADKGRLDQLVAAGTITRYKLTDGMIELHVPPLKPAQYFSASLRVIPTLAGTLQSGASTVTVRGIDVFVPPAAWKIGG